MLKALLWIVGGFMLPVLLFVIPVVNMIAMVIGVIMMIYGIYLFWKALFKGAHKVAANATEKEVKKG